MISESDIAVPSQKKARNTFSRLFSSFSREIQNELLFTENILGVLTGKELKVKSSYPLGSCPNLGLKINIRHYESFRRLLKTNVRHYDSFRRILTDLVI